ncbi:MAG: glycosyltransferase [Actinomycetota bacterium]
MTTRPRARTLPSVDEVRIFVTVGTELPFDRLVRTVDRWAAERSLGHSVLAQVGDTTITPTAMAWSPFIPAQEFRSYFAHADLVVAHAGMGTIISALRDQRPLLVMPRRSALGEHRSDHQYATATRLAEMGWVDVAMDEHELPSLLDRPQLTDRPRVGPFAQDSLISAVRDELDRLTSGRASS